MHTFVLAALPLLTNVIADTTDMTAITSAETGDCAVGELCAHTQKPVLFVQDAQTVLRDSSRAVNSDLAIYSVGVIPQEVMVIVDIDHSARGDLELNLYSPEGNRYRLKRPNAADPTDDLKTWWVVTVAGEVITGDWRLEIVDHYFENDGHLNTWGLVFSETGFETPWLHRLGTY